MNKRRNWCLVSGTLVLAGLALAHWHNPYWLILTAIVGLDLLQSGFTETGIARWLAGDR
jgi:hypothetical protein